MKKIKEKKKKKKNEEKRRKKGKKWKKGKSWQRLIRTEQDRAQPAEIDQSLSKWWSKGSAWTAYWRLNAGKCSIQDRFKIDSRSGKDRKGTGQGWFQDDKNLQKLSLINLWTIFVRKSGAPTCRQGVRNIVSPKVTHCRRKSAIIFFDVNENKVLLFRATCGIKITKF